MNSSRREEGTRDQQNDQQSPQDGATNMQLANMGSSQSLKNLESMMVKKTVSKSTVLYCPFVNNAKELGFKLTFATITMGFLGKSKLSNDDKSTFWEEHKQMAHKALNVKRANISGQLRKHFVGKLAQMHTCYASPLINHPLT